ncbi:MAG TPA: nitroreductase family protein, partial [Terriglobia bacterium]|nr:nitroreductase family protein [Terriglobia bacterium]
ISETFAGYNRNWAPQAPVLILGTTNTKLSRHDAANIYAMYDLGAATAMLVLQATALGLATHQMGGFDHDAIREALQIPEEYALGSVMALGYQAEPAALADEELIKREMAPRSRKPVTEIAFSAWNEPAPLE